MDVNAYLETLAAPNLITFDSYPILADNGATSDQHTHELLHLNETGFDVLNQVLVPLLKKLDSQKRSHQFEY